MDTLPVGGEADRWFGEFLDVRCKLVHMPDESARPVDPDYGEPGDQAGLHDGFPFLVISEASLADLNARLEHPLPMDRFRPNLVVEGCEPFAEDDWRLARIGPITLRVAKPCARCAITTVDQRTAATGREPLRTLATFRRKGTKVLVWAESHPRRAGRLACGRSRGGLAGPIDPTPTTPRRGEKATLCILAAPSCSYMDR